MKNCPIFCENQVQNETNKNYLEFVFFKCSLFFQSDNDADNFEKLLSSIKESNEVRFCFQLNSFHVFVFYRKYLFFYVAAIDNLNPKFNYNIADLVL